MVSLDDAMTLLILAGLFAVLTGRLVPRRTFGRDL